MSTKREVERNEKIIRGLMKLPPNRRCINCNSLGPQYVCTNFWTFVCMICSGIHREFTHRVKSVSMSKFTSQEVEALQNGGNQRAREMFLKHWDLNRQRQPNSSNVDKVREFIKAVYVDCQYAGGNNSEKPPQDMQSQRNVGDETRRASSYHSFSQSPPYDFQYEDRLNRKHKGLFNRKPGSDHNLFDRKVASSIYSPGRLSEHLYEDRFANEGSSSRASDYSFSSGDPFKSEPQSPNLQKNDGFSSPTSDSSREICDGLHHQTPSTYLETYAKVDKAPLQQPQRTVSLGSIGSAEKNSVSLHSELNHSTITTQNEAFGTPSPLPIGNSGEVNFFEDAMVMPVPHSTAGVDLFQGQNLGSVASMGSYHKSADSSALSQGYPSDFCFSSTICQNPPSPILNQKLCEPSEPSNEGWATFDLPPSPPGHKPLGSLGSKAELEHPVGPSEGGLQWPGSQNSGVYSPPFLVSNPWSEDLQHAHVATNMPSSQIWKPFDEANEHYQCNDTNLQASVKNASSNIDLFASFGTQENIDVDGLQQIASTTEGFSFQTFPSNVSSGSSFVEPMHPFTSDKLWQHSGNPFDVLFDSKSEAHDMFLDMSTLQTALPSEPLPSSYIGGTNKPWFHENPVASPGGMSYTIAEARSSQLQNAPTQGSVASFGGNPFA